jgi:hypothetical protein
LGVTTAELYIYVFVVVCICIASNASVLCP